MSKEMMVSLLLDRIVAVDRHTDESDPDSLKGISDALDCLIKLGYFSEE